MPHIEPEMGTFRIRARLMHGALEARNDRTVRPAPAFAALLAGRPPRGTRAGVEVAASPAAQPRRA